MVPKNPDFHFRIGQKIRKRKNRKNQNLSLISQVPTIAVDLICPLLQGVQFLWNYLSSTVGPHMDLSQSDFGMDYTPNGQEHEQHFA